MKHDHKTKIKTLNNILKEYAKHFTYFDECKCYDLGLRFAVIFKSSNGKRYKSLIRKIPREDIDILIARYRSKLSYILEKNQAKEVNKKCNYFVITLFKKLFKIK